MGPDSSSSATGGAAPQVGERAASPVVYDTAVVGGGPAGLTAGLHLAWHGRKVVVIDRTTGPLYFTLELLHNVPGMPAASGAEIQKRLRAQARDMGAELVRGNVVSAAGAAGDFQLAGADGEQWRAPSAGCWATSATCTASSWTAARRWRRRPSSSPARRRAAPTWCASLASR